MHVHNRIASAVAVMALIGAQKGWHSCRFNERGKRRIKDPLLPWRVQRKLV